MMHPNPDLLNHDTKTLKLKTARQSFEPKCPHNLTTVTGPHINWKDKVY